MNFFSFSAIFNGCTSLLLVPVLFLKKPKTSTNNLFLLFLLAVTEWSWFYFLWLITPDRIIAEYYARTCMIGVIFMAPIFFHFIVSLLEIKTKQFLIITNYIIAAFFAFLAYSPLYIIGMKSIYFISLWPIPGKIFSYAVTQFILVYLYTHILMLQAIKSKSGAFKNQIVYVFIGTFVGGLAGATNFLSWYLALPPIFNILTSIYIVMVTYAIVKHSLMDIRVVITKSAAYGLIGALMVLSFSVLNLTPITNIRLLSFLLNCSLAIFWALAAHRLREFIQTPLEEKWITDWYDSEKLVNSIAQKLVPVLERDAVFQTIADELNAKIKIKNIEILPPGSQYDGLDVAPVEKGVVIPLSSGGGPEGTLLIGPKISEDAYNDKDITLFKTIQAMALSIFDRIRPYEKIKKDFEANEKKLYDTERTLARSEKIASLANLIREYNHEIKTPLSIIRGETALLPKQPRDQSYLDNFRDLVYEQVDRANDIVESTLRLSLPKERKEVELNINEIIEGALRLFPLSGVHLEKMLASVPNIKGDRADLELVFVNLFKNAVEAMPDGGQITVKSHQQQEGEESFVYIEVSDTGAGIPAENLERIFEPFFSTHVTKGRGLGLSIVFRIVREHLGHVDVKSQLGKGTTFILKFPVK